jgi:hypothetical protein
VESNLMNDSESRRCSKCKIDLPLERFGQSKNARKAAYCKACMSLYCRHHYVQNKEAHNARRREAARRYRKRNRAYVVEYLRTHPCVDCGEADPIVLEFDHVESESKEFSIAELSRSDCSVLQLQREMNKCVVRCVHCHRRRTARQFGWRKGISLLIGM